MHFAGMQLVPPALVPVVRGALASKGVAGSLVNDNGEVDALSLLSALYNKIEIRTAMSPPVTIDLNAPSDPRTAATMKLVQPAILFDGPGGHAEIAPYGVPSGFSPEVKTAAIGLAIGVAAGAFGLVLLGGAFFGKRR